MRLRKRIARASLRSLVVSVGLVAVALVVILRTALGHEVVLNWAVGQLRNQVAGGVEVSEIRSANILRGGRLLGIRLLTPDGQPFLTADSLEAAFDLRSMLTGAPGLNGVRLWGGRLELTWTEGVEGSSLDRWLGREPSGDRADRGAAEAADGRAGAGGEGAPADSVAEGRGGFRLDDVEVHDFQLRLRTPSRLDPEGLVRVFDDGDRRLALDVDLDRVRIPSASLGGDAAGGTRLDVAEASGRVHILRDPIPVQGLQGRLRIRGDELVAQVARLAIPTFVAQGDVRVALTDDAPEVVGLDLELDRLDTGDLAWLSEWIPAARGVARVEGSVTRRTSSWRLSGADLDWDGGRVRGGGTMATGPEGVTLDEVQLTFEGVPARALGPYLPTASERRGQLSGNARLDGPVDRLGLLGRITLRDGEARTSSADVSAVIVADAAGVGIRDGEITVAPLDFRMAEEWIPGLPVAGEGMGRFQVDGRFDRSLRFGADVTQVSEAGRSRVVAQGSARRLGEGRWSLDVQGDAAPLHLAALKAGFPDLPVAGAATGSFRVRGIPGDLALSVDLQGESGSLVASGRLDPADWTEGVEVSARAQDFALGAFLPALGTPTRLTGTLELGARGRGTELEGAAELRLAASQLRGMRVDSVRIASAAADGRVVVDTLRLNVGGFAVRGSGEMPMEEDPRRPGRLALEFRTPSLMGIRPAFLGPVVHARDTLGPLDADILRLSGIEPDTLPLLAEVVTEGEVEGRLVLEGALADFQGEADASFRGLRYGDAFVEAATLRVQGRGLPGDAATLDVALDTDSLRVAGQSLTRTQVRAVLGRTVARLSALLQRGVRDELALAGGLEIGDDQYRINVDEGRARFDSLEYVLQAPAQVAWTDSALTVRGLDIRRNGQDPVRIQGDGVLARRGPLDLTARVEGLRLELLPAVLPDQLPELAGRVDLDLRVTGTGESPEIAAEVAAQGVAWRDFETERAEGSLMYRDRRAQLDLGAWENGARVLALEGTVPVDLSLAPGVDRAVDEAMDVRIRARDVEVAPILFLLEDLERVEGRLNGDFRVAGTLDAPEPSGTLRLEEGAWTVGALGVRQSQVEGTFDLSPDGSVAVTASGRAGGRVEVRGEVAFAPASNPQLDLSLDFQRFQAVDRRDVNGVMTGSVTLTGSYRRPSIAGQVRVDQGTIFLEEFRRAVGVVDLTDPIFLDLVDDPFAAGRPLLAQTRNPFMDNLRVNVDLTVERDTWLRSPELNVEIGGDLIVVYDRPSRDLVLVGQLLARRGQYVFLRRTFGVEGGTVDFIGTPGINPILNIEASTQVRRRQSESLDIIATVEGPLVSPRVELSSEEAGLAESDLVSYLIWGRPSSELTAGALSTQGQVVGTALAGTVAGTLASQLGTLAAQSIGTIDYLAVSQAGDLQLGGGSLGSSVSSTQIEVGSYFGGGDFFGAVIFRPLFQLGGASTVPIGGARVEWQASDQFHVEAFVEDRFLRTLGFGFSEIARGVDFTYGLSLYREWGY